MYSVLNYSQNNGVYIYIYIYLINLRTIHTHTTDKYVHLFILLTHLWNMYLYIY